MPKFTSRQRTYIRKRTKKVELDPSEMAGELNIVPFLDIVVNLIMFLLATSEAVLLMSQIESDLPQIATGRSSSNEEVTSPLNLNVMVTEDGVLVSGSGGKLAAGCEQIETGRGITVPMGSGGQYDWPGLTQCVAKVKNNYQDETSVTVSADPAVRYEYVVAAMDAVRNQGERELFPRVLISVGVR